MTMCDRRKSPSEKRVNKTGPKNHNANERGATDKTSRRTGIKRGSGGRTGIAETGNLEGGMLRGAEKGPVLGG